MALVLSSRSAADPSANASPILTMRRIYSDHFIPVRHGVAYHLPRAMNRNLTRWERFSGNPPVEAIDAESFHKFREKGRAAGFCKSTLERTVRAVMKLLRFALDCGMVATIPSEQQIRWRPPVPHKKVFSTAELPKRENDLTLRTIYSDHFVPIRRRIAASTLQKMEHELNRWERLTGNPALEAIDAESFNTFRKNGQLADLSSNTIETTISSMMQLLRFAYNEELIQKIPKKGEPLRRYRTRGFVPSVQDLDLMYRYAETTVWPRFPLFPGDFWKAWLCCSYFTGLRLQDQMENLLWSNLTDDALIVEANKTGKVHVFPVPDVLREHLEPLRLLDDERIFPVKKSPHLVRRELHRMCEEAGIPHKIGPQSLRRLAGTQWQRARWGAGQMLLGHTLGVSDFYIAPEILVDALKALEVPPAFYEPKDKSLIGSENKPASPIYKFSQLNETERAVVSKVIDEVIGRLRSDSPQADLRVYEEGA